MQGIKQIIVYMSLASASFLHGQTLPGLLPDIPPGWNLSESYKIYTPESLYDYINGAAELYLSYGMKDVISQIIVQDENEIRIEIFDMTEAKNAFGVFTHTRTHNDHKYGQGSQLFTGAQIFWKDRFFVSVTANDENDPISAALQFISENIESQITSSGKIPAIIELLPEPELEPDGFLYFHHYIWLNSYYYIANDNFLNIDSSTDAVLARYGNKDNRRYVLMIRYPESMTASNACAAFKERFLDPGNEECCEQIEDGSWLGAAALDAYFVAVFNATDEAKATDLINACKEKIKKTKNHE